MSVEVKKESPYQILGKWLNDKSKLSPIPKELEEDKTIGPQYILYYFQTSPYILFLNDLFNNFDIYQMDRIDSFKMIKDICLKTSFKQKYINNSKEKDTQLNKSLAKQYPHLKKYEVGYLGRVIDTLDNKDTIYETLGLTKPKKQKINVKENKIKKEKPKTENYSFDNLMSNFQ